MVVAHVACALVGFGAIALSGAYAHTARDVDRPGTLEEATRFFRPRSVADLVLLAVPVLGVAAVAVDPSGKGLGAAWVAIAVVLWLASAAVVLLVARPARTELVAALRATTGAQPLDVDAVRAVATRLAWAAAVCDAVFVVAVVDMVIQPG